jgi:hypothetical protein
LVNLLMESCEVMALSKSAWLGWFAIQISNRFSIDEGLGFLFGLALVDLLGTFSGLGAGQ